MVAHNCHGQTENLTAKTKTSRQNQNLTAKTKYLTAKSKTSRQNQILHSKSKIALVLPWVFAFAVRYLVFAVNYLVLSWGVCREGFVVRYFVFAVSFLVLQWGFCFCREVFGFAVRYFVFAVSFLVLPWHLWATVLVCYTAVFSVVNDTKNGCVADYSTYLTSCALWLSNDLYWDILH